MNEKRMIDVEKLKEKIDGAIENQRCDPGVEYPAYLHESTIESIIDSLAQPVELDQISSKDYGADGVGLTHAEVEALEKRIEEKDAEIARLKQPIPESPDLVKAREAYQESELISWRVSGYVKALESEIARLRGGK